VKAVVMTRKRRAPKYAGTLAQPIYLDPDDYKYAGVGLGQPPYSNPNVAAEKMREVVQTQTFKKMQLLFKHYEIDPTNEQRWQALAFSLALTHVPGMQIASRPKPGRKPTWKTGLGDELVRAVEDVKSRTGERTTEAIAKLQEELGAKWGTYTPENLGARYQEARAQQKARQRVLASLHEDWEKGIVFGVDLAALFATAAPVGRPHEVTGRATKIGARAKTSRRK
jgi:hypothetical protein